MRDGGVPNGNSSFQNDSSHNDVDKQIPTLGNLIRLPAFQTYHIGASAIGLLL
jgi:hypothetical protein